MFTGIISSIGKIKTKSKVLLRIACSKDLINKLSMGQSIAVNGICLTIVKVNKGSFDINLMPETVSKTTIPYLHVNQQVNLELPVTPKTLLAGHIVQGHVDGLAKLVSITQKDQSLLLKFSMPVLLCKYIVNKGSIAVDGISLTVIEALQDGFVVGIIPYTWKKTVLHHLKIEDFVNIEVDILAKYLEKLGERI